MKKWASMLPWSGAKRPTTDRTPIHRTTLASDHPTGEAGVIRWRWYQNLDLTRPEGSALAAEQAENAIRFRGMKG